MANIGIQTVTSARTGPSNPGVNQGRFHIAGLTAKGPTDRVSLVTSLGEFVAIYGARTAYSNSMYDTARLFFEEGGSELIVSRVVGPNATNGSLTLNGGTASPTLRVEAVDPGAHASELSVEVTVAAGTFTISAYLGTERVARYAGLANPAAAVQAFDGHPYLRVRDLGSTVTAPGNNPIALTRTPLTAGSDDRALVTTAHVMAALELADQVGQGGCVAAPGYSAEIIGALLLDHAERHRKIALLAMDSDSTVTEATTAAATLSATAGNGEFGGLFHPWVRVPDGGGSRIVSPEGYVAAVRARTAISEGFWQVPAGDRARTRWVMGTVTAVSAATNNVLSEGQVNGITTTLGRGVRLYNWTSLSVDENFALLSDRDTINNLALIVENALEPYVWAGIDGKGRRLGYVQAAVTGVLEPIARAGGLFANYDAESGDLIDPGYAVVVDRTNNPNESLAQNKVSVQVSVRLAPAAALIQVEIVKISLTAAV